jgi:hypothetical protein
VHALGAPVGEARKLPEKSQKNGNDES